MTNWKNESTDRLCKALLQLKTEAECYAFLEDICTIKEIQSIAQRLAVAERLMQKESYADIGEETGASSATICRVNRCLAYGAGGYQTVLSRMGVKKHD